MSDLNRTSVDFQAPVTSPLVWLRTLGDALERTEVSVQGHRVSLQEGFERFIELIKEAQVKNLGVWWVGNGGSNAICAHLSQDLMNKLGVRSQAFSDTSLLTCMANDFGYAQVFARPLETLARTGDILIAISSSGNSQNILEAVGVAHQKRMRVVGVSGFKPDNALRQLPTDVSFYLPTHLYGTAEVGHEALLHAALECLYLRSTVN